MAVPVNDAATLADEDAQRMRQIVHDLRTPLSVICMGLEALKHIRHDEEQFTQVLQMISAEGTEPLKVLISDLADSAVRRVSLPSPK